MMPRRCCAPNCRGNYTSTLKDNNYTSVFLFPKDEELRKKWITAIPRKNWAPTKYSALCSLHFAEADIERYQCIVSPDGVLQNVLLRCPKLVAHAVPSIFPDSPPYLKKHLQSQRKDPKECHRSQGFFRKEVMKSELDNAQYKLELSYNKSLEKIQKAGQDGKSINALIGQGSKYMKIQTPVSQSLKVKESQMTEEIKIQSAIEEAKITKLQKKLEAVEETISSLSASNNAELRAKEEILKLLNGNWEPRSKYYCEIVESFKEFQQHKDNLLQLYNNVIRTQQLTIKNLQQELSTIKSRDKEHKNVVNEIENKAAEHEKRLQEMMIVETKLKEQLEEVKEKSMLEKDQLHNVYAEEKLGLMKNQEEIMLINKDLKVQLEKVEEEKQNLSTQLMKKGEKISKLQEEITMCKDKVQDLLHRNTELSLMYEEAIQKGKKPKTQLESKVQEIVKTQEYLNVRQEIETSLITDNSDLERSLESMKDNNWYE